MRYIKKTEEIKKTEYFMNLALEEAKKSACRKSQRGAVIIKDDRIVGRGYNKITLESLCNPCVREEIKDNSRAELCSAIHAEQMAIIDAINKVKPLRGSIMYHIKVKNKEIKQVEDLSCTVCSRMIYESGIAEFILLQEKGYVAYNAEELNRLSFDYFLKSKI